MTAPTAPTVRGYDERDFDEMTDALLGRLQQAVDAFADRAAEDFGAPIDLSPRDLDSLVVTAERIAAKIAARITEHKEQ